jgi:hypothetical protein
MTRRPPFQFVARLLFAGLSLVLSFSIGVSTQARQAIKSAGISAYEQSASPASSSKWYLPLVMYQSQMIELLDTWTSGALFSRQTAFQPGASITYHASGVNHFTMPVQVSLRWTQSGPCGSSTLSSETVSLPPGPWEQTISLQTPNCTGIFTSTAQISNKVYSFSLSTTFVTNTPSTVRVSNSQGFDRCYFPDVDQMQTWWTKSPYWVFNLYLGGSSFACKDQPLDAFWVHQVASQGWTFILTWVGPQAPCTRYLSKMSADSGQAYLQGKTEADAAVDSATRLGFLGNRAIYYDVEGYSGGDSSCRTAVQSFMRGWVERLHAHGFKAGGYGGACSSYVIDWASNNPAPDDVWLAHWYKSTYDSGATVWNTPCVGNSLWANHQRLKQYAGGHSETWGGVSLAIDSNVLDGQVTSLLGNSISATLNDAPMPVTLQGSPLQAAGLIDQNRGWALAAERLLWTEDGGATWRDISPVFSGAYRILGVTFRLPFDGWVVLQSLNADGGSAIQVVHTRDGVTWETSLLNSITVEEADAIQAAYLDIRDDSSAMLALKLESGSSFSLGRLFATQDGGHTWQERSLPMGEPVKFLDALHGWIAGGPTGNMLFRTQDGGETWQPQVLPLPSVRRVQVGLPHFYGNQLARLPAIISGQTGKTLALFSSQDAGNTWSLQMNLPIDPATSWAELPAVGLALAGTLPAASIRDSLASNALPDGAVWLDFLDTQHGWSLVQESSCQGVKQPGLETSQPDSQPFTCQISPHLLATEDGGTHWREISPNP